MQSMVVLHNTRYSHVTLSVGARGRRPSLRRTAGSEVNLTSKVESFLFVLWWYVVRVEEVCRCTNEGAHLCTPLPVHGQSEPRPRPPQAEQGR